MKQLAILMAFLLAVMLMITGIMGVGNARQAEQMTERAMQLSSARAELRKVKKEKAALTETLEASQAQVEKLLREQKAVGQKLDGLLLLAQEKEQSTPASLLPMETAGTALLKAGALEKAMFMQSGVQAVMAGQTAAMPVEAAAKEAAGPADNGRICWALGKDVPTEDSATAEPVPEPDPGAVSETVPASGALSGADAASPAGKAPDDGAAESMPPVQEATAAEPAASGGAVLAVSDAVQLEVCGRQAVCCAGAGCACGMPEENPDAGMPPSPMEQLLDKLRPCVQKLEAAVRELGQLLLQTAAER